MKKIFFALVVLVLLTTIVNADININTCANLTLNNEKYLLTTNIIDSPANTCIDIRADNIILDCQGYTLDGIGIFGPYGIYAYMHENITIKNCVLKEWGTGIYLNSVHGSKVLGNTVDHNMDDGIFLFRTHNNTLTDNTANYNWDGITLSQGSNNIFIRNSASNNQGNGIAIAGAFGGTEGSNSNWLIDNTINDNGNDGISFWSNSYYNNLTGNRACRNNIDINDMDSNSGNTMDINNSCETTSNWNDYDTTGCTFPCACTCTSCAECEQKLNDPSCPIVELTADIATTTTCINNPPNFKDKTFDCIGHTIDGDDVGNDYGIYINGTSGNTIKNCIINDFFRGIYLSYSQDNTLQRNTLNSNHDGIYLMYSENNTLISNTADSNTWGIHLFYSGKNKLDSNRMNSNDYGMDIVSSANNILYANRMSNNDYNFDISGWLAHYYQDIDTTNTVDDGKPIYYWTNENEACRDKEVPATAGFVALVSCDNISVNNLDIHNNGKGILLVNTSNSKISDNLVYSNDHGIELVYSPYNIITGNIAYSNWLGMHFYLANNNIIMENDANYNRYNGISLWYSLNNSITENNASSNDDISVLNLNSAGLYLYGSSNNTIINNTANNNWHGIYLIRQSDTNEISTNEFFNNFERGVTITACDHQGWCPGGNTGNNLKENNILYNTIGIYSHNSTSLIFSNNVCDNTNLDFSSSNWLLSFGNDNTCNKPDGWNDAGMIGCTYICGGCNCSTCHECEFKLNLTSCPTVYLTKNISDHAVTCIDNPSFFNSKTFDCMGNTIDGTGTGYGIYLNEKSRNLIRNCVIKEFEAGILLENSSNNTLASNIANYNNPYGFWLVSSSYNTLTHNIANNNTWGVRLKDSSNNIITKHTTDSNEVGIYLFISSNNNITNNTASLNDWYGIYLISSSDRNSLIYNNVSSNNWAGIYITSKNNLVKKNTANLNGDGIGLSSSRNNILTENSAINNKEDGIYLYSSSHNNIVKNNISFNSQSGIRLHHSSNNNILKENTANNNTDGIYINESSYNNISRNMVRFNKIRGINLRSDSNHNGVTDNLVYANEEGIAVLSSPDNYFNHNKILENNFDGFWIDRSSSLAFWNNTAIKNYRAVHIRQSDNGIFFENEFSRNYGYGIFSLDSNLSVISNKVCANVDKDFYSNDWLSSSGRDNICTTPDTWRDEGAKGCRFSCEGCLPHLISGKPSDKIDIVFIADYDYNNDTTKFLQDVEGRIDMYRNTAPINNQMNKFNFYYMEIPANASLHCGTPPTEFNDPSCDMADAVAFLHKRNFWDCSNSMSRFSAEGSGTRSFIHESGHAVFGLEDEYKGPTHYDYNNARGSPPNIWPTNASCRAFAATKSWNPDDCRNYCPPGSYSGADFNNNGTDDHWKAICDGYLCRNDWSDTRFLPCYNTTNGWWKIDHNAPEIMVDNNNGFGKACTNRVNWTLNQYVDPPEEEDIKSVKINLNFKNEIITELGTRIAYAYPRNHIIQWDDFNINIKGSNGTLLESYGIRDPRLIFGGLNGTFYDILEDVDFDAVFPFYSNLRFLAIADGTTNKTLIEVDIAEEVHNFCEEWSYNDSDCINLDTDDDGYNNPVDNCPLTHNPDQEDLDTNGVGDACEKKSFTITLNPGWNLFSIPLRLVNKSTDHVLSSIDYSDIYGYKNGWFVPQTLNTKYSYWIKVDSQQTLEIEGQPAVQALTFSTGWNLIGYPYLTDKDTSELFDNANVYAYNGSWSSHIPNRTFNPLQTLKPGYGYWIKKI